MQRDTNSAGERDTTEKALIEEEKEDIKFEDYHTTSSSHIYPTCITTKFVEVSDYLTLIDGVNSFIVEYDITKIKVIYQSCLNLLVTPTLKQIFEPRGIHHLILLFDGLVKLRCLFRDYDPVFKPTEEDYEVLEQVIVFIVSTWKAGLGRSILSNLFFYFDYKGIYI